MDFGNESLRTTSQDPIASTSRDDSPLNSIIDKGLLDSDVYLADDDEESLLTGSEECSETSDTEDDDETQTSTKLLGESGKSNDYKNPDFNGMSLQGTINRVEIREDALKYEIETTESDDDESVYVVSEQAELENGTAIPVVNFTPMTESRDSLYDYLMSFPTVTVTCTLEETRTMREIPLKGIPYCKVRNYDKFVKCPQGRVFDFDRKSKSKHIEQSSDSPEKTRTSYLRLHGLNHWRGSDSDKETASEGDSVREDVFVNTETEKDKRGQSTLSVIRKVGMIKGVEQCFDAKEYLLLYTNLDSDNVFVESSSASIGSMRYEHAIYSSFLANFCPVQDRLEGYVTCLMLWLAQRNVLPEGWFDYVNERFASGFIRKTVPLKNYLNEVERWNFKKLNIKRGTPCLDGMPVAVTYARKTLPALTETRNDEHSGSTLHSNAAKRFVFHMLSLEKAIPTVGDYDYFWKNQFGANYMSSPFVLNLNNLGLMPKEKRKDPNKKSYGIVESYNSMAYPSSRRT